MKRVGIPVIAFLLVITAAPALCADLSIDVSPLRVEAKAAPGSEYTNAIRVESSGIEPVRLRAYIEDWYLDEKGTPIFRAVGTVPGSSSPLHSYPR